MYVSEKVAIKNLLFHVTNERVLSELEGISNVQILSKVMYSRERYESNNLTDCYNGDHFLYVKGPVIPPLNMYIKLAYEQCVKSKMNNV